MKKLFSFLIIISLVLPVTGGVVTETDDADCGGCGGCGCAAMTCCPADADGSGEAPANAPANQLRVSAPDLGLIPVDYFLRALDETAAETPSADRLYRLPKLHVSSLVRNCTFLI